MQLGYARVSTGEQDFSMQVEALKAAGCERVFAESASGATKDRPELTAALSHSRAGDTLVVWRLDRLGRSLPHLVEIVGKLEKANVGFRSLSEGIDTTTPNGRLIFHIFGALAEFERELIRERTRAGLASARARGRKGGRPPKLGAEKMRIARRLLTDSDTTVSEVARTLGVHRSTLHKALSVDAGGEQRCERSAGEKIASGPRRTLAAPSTNRSGSSVSGRRGGQTA
jgi:DNA invertase Pin-like site-specific DNA recombinase